MEMKNASGKRFCFCFHRKQEAVDSVQVDLDLVWSRKTTYNLTGDIHQQRFLMVFLGLGHYFKIFFLEP